jgi:membrane protein YqaA with SNARE-associated domain
MKEARQVVFHSARQVDPDQKFFEKRRRRAEYGKYLLIVIMLTILIGTLTVVMGLLQAPVLTLISAL